MITHGVFMIILAFCQSFSISSDFIFSLPEMPQSTSPSVEVMLAQWIPSGLLLLDI